MAQKEKIRNLILHAAQDVFKKYGYKKAGMDDIALAANKGKSSIYYYYESKEEIFKAVIRHEARQLQLKINENVARQKTPVDRVKTYVLYRMTELENYKNLQQLLKTGQLDYLPFVAIFKERYQQQEIRTFQLILEDGVRQNIFKIYDVHIAATAIIVAMRGMDLPIQEHNNRQEASRIIDDIVNILLYGIIKR